MVEKPFADDKVWDVSDDEYSTKRKVKTKIISEETMTIPKETSAVLPPVVSLPLKQSNCPGHEELRQR